MSESSVNSTRGSGGLSTDILKSEGVAAIKRTAEDIKLVQRAVRNGWNVPAENRQPVIKRLVGIVEKTECTIMTKEGPVALDGPADANAVAAARALIAMDQVDQEDHWNAEKNARLDEGKPTERVGGVQFDYGD